MHNEAGEDVEYTITPQQVPGYLVVCEKVEPELPEGASPDDAAGVQEAVLYQITYILDTSAEEKQPAGIDENPRAREPIYTGEPRDLIDKGSASGGELMYALGQSADVAPDLSKFSGTLPTATNAGTYYVWYYVKGDARWC